eukprot:6970286-Ditylum_brightwellii.AAC.1
MGHVHGDSVTGFSPLAYHHDNSGITGNMNMGPFAPYSQRHSQQPFWPDQPNSYIHPNRHDYCQYPRTRDEQPPDVSGPSIPPPSSAVLIANHVSEPYMQADQRSPR